MRSRCRWKTTANIYLTILVKVRIDGKNVKKQQFSNSLSINFCTQASFIPCVCNNVTSSHTTQMIIVIITSNYIFICQSKLQFAVVIKNSKLLIASKDSFGSHFSLPKKIKISALHNPKKIRMRIKSFVKAFHPERRKESFQVRTERTSEMAYLCL